MSEGARRIVHPDCCDKMRQVQSISLSLPNSIYEGDIETPPFWVVGGWRSWHIEPEIKTEEKDGVTRTTDIIYPDEDDWPVPQTDEELMRWGVRATYCPFCGEHVPPIVPREVNLPERIATCSDGGYYCDTCSQRLNQCQCFPPQWRWMPYKYYAEFGDDRICKCGHPYHRHFDPFEEPSMRAVGCKYCDCHIFEEQK